MPRPRVFAAPPVVWRQPLLFKFEIPSLLQRVNLRQTFTLGDVHGAADNVKHGLGFVLFVVDGVLSMLEGYTYDEPWPDEPRGLILTYSTDQARDWDALHKILRPTRL